jgi:UDPglucose 6-dehydrogenase
MRVAVFGAGYVGLTTGVALAWLGMPVTLVDVDPAKVDAIQAGHAPIYEEHLAPLLTAVRGQERLSATLDPSAAVTAADVIFIAVNTPPGPTGAADMQYVQAASLTIGRHLSPERDRVVVTKSTVPIGTANLVRVWVEDGWREAHGDAPIPTFAVASNPEFLREGQALFDSFYPDRIVIGTDEPWALERLETLYGPLIRQDFAPPPGLPRPSGLQAVPVARADRVSAEMIKYAANAFLATKISFANEMARICDEVGADVTVVMRAIGLDQRIGKEFLEAGVGWGGSCFGKDLAALIHTAREYGLEPRLIEATVAVNRAQRHQVVKELQELLKTLRGRRIAVWGLAFKPGTDDLRDSPALTVIEELTGLGARVIAYDPVAMDNARRAFTQLDVRFAPSALSAADGADALLLLTAWPEFRTVPPERLRAVMAQPVVVDGRNLWDPVAMRGYGFVYRGIGRGM